MKARPILFSGPMARALLAGKKTQTRRVVKRHPLIDGGNFTDDYVRLPENHVAEDCPYGKPGDLLWVRESITTRDKAEDGLRFDPPQYRADFTDPYGLCFTTDEGPRYAEQLRWTPSIHMPRWASRLTLRITDVRVKRLQEITREHARSEGVEQVSELLSVPLWRDYVFGGAPYADPRLSFQSLWASINGPGSWDANPWVWAITFEMIRANVDAVMAQKAAA